MRTIIHTIGADNRPHLFSFETSPLLSQEEQIKKVVERDKLQDFKIVDVQSFDAHELKGANE